MRGPAPSARRKLQLWDVPASDAWGFAVRESLAALVLVPLALAALALFAVPYRLTGLAARRFTREPDVAATAKVIAGAVVYGAWLLLLSSVAGWTAGRGAALSTALAIPALAVAGLFAIERESAVLETVRAWLRLRRARRRTRARLRQHRAELADVLDEINEWIGS